MSKIENIKFEGKIINKVPGKFTVEIAGAKGQAFQILSSLGRKIMKNKIPVVVGDIVEVEVSPYDIHNLKKGAVSGIISRRC